MVESESEDDGEDKFASKLASHGELGALTTSN